MEIRDLIWLLRRGLRLLIPGLVLGAFLGLAAVVI